MTVEVRKPITKAKLEKAAKLIAAKSKRKTFNAKKHLGKLKGVYGDAIEYQKKLRNEWD